MTGHMVSPWGPASGSAFPVRIVKQEQVPLECAVTTTVYVVHEGTKLPMAEDSSGSGKKVGRSLYVGGGVDLLK